jgi:predicted anti-sigma-YlaC factor YlaD
MHGLIKARLEEYLKGVPGSHLPAALEQHLKTCRECRDELTRIEEQAILLRALRAPAELEPTAGFYARVMDRIEVEAQQKASFWNAFLEPVFGRRLAVASLALILVLGGFLALSEGESASPPLSADTIIAVDEHPPDLGMDQQRDRDTILATLATYRE